MGASQCGGQHAQNQLLRQVMQRLAGPSRLPQVAGGQVVIHNKQCASLRQVEAGVVVQVGGLAGVGDLAGWAGRSESFFRGLPKGSSLKVAMRDRLLRQQPGIYFHH